MPRRGGLLKTRRLLASALGVMLAGLAAAQQGQPPAAPAAAASAAEPAPVPPAPPATLATSATATADAFQGLPWGADEAQVQARFGSRLIVTRCDDTLRREAQAGGESCEIPTVPRYDVAGIPFTLRLHLDAATRRLVRVSLRHAGEPAADPGRHGDDARFGDQHRALRRLLTQRYGSPEASDVNTEPGNPVAHARWRRADTLIELSSTFVPRSGDRPPLDRVQIVYQPITWGDAGKL